MIRLFNKGKKNEEPLIQRIKYDGPQDGEPWLVYKYPGESFVLGSKLIVNQGQEALFFKGGKALDLFGPGTHTLQTGNLPLLNKVVNLPYGGDTPFTAEIYYINKTSKLDMKWGTAQGFPVEDPKYGLILTIRSYGTYGLRIDDTRMFVSELVGAVPHGTMLTHEFADEYFNGLLTSKIKHVISAYMIRQKISFLEVTGYLEDISKDCEAAMGDEFERFGTELVNFYVKAINPPKNEYEELAKRKAELAMGIDFYKTRRTFDLMEGMIENDNVSSLANIGAGLGMGMGVAANAGSMFQNISSNMEPSSGVDRGRNETGGNACPNCGANNPAGQKFCGTCGNAMITGIKCASCGAINPTGQKFCGECGKKLVKICPTCGKEYEPSQRFCGDCGTRL